MKQEINFNYLKDLAGHNSEFLNNLVDAISVTLADYPNSLSEAMEKGDYQMLKHYAHKFKSSTAYIGYDALNKALTDIETYEDLKLSSKQLNELIASVKQYSSIALDEIKSFSA